MQDGVAPSIPHAPLVSVLVDDLGDLQTRLLKELERAVRGDDL